MWMFTVVIENGTILKTLGREMYMKESVKLFDMMTGQPTPRVVEVDFF